MAWWLHEGVLHAFETCSQSKLTTFQWSRPSHVKRQSNVFFTQWIWPLDEVLCVWSFLAGILSIQIALMQISTLSTRPFIESVGASHDSWLLLVIEINVVKCDFLVKTCVYSLFSVSFCSNTKDSLCFCFMKIRVQYDPSDNSCCIHKLRLNIWFTSNRRLDREGHFVGFLGLNVSSRKSHTFEQFPAEIAAVNSNDEILK